MDIAKIIDNRIKLNAECKNSEDILNTIANFRYYNSLISPQDIYNNLKKRETMGSTAIGFGIAVPHCRIYALDTTFISIIRTTQGINFSAPDNLPVNLFISLLVPQNAEQTHLNLLANIANMCADEDMRKNLHTLTDEKQILQQIQLYFAKI